MRHLTRRKFVAAAGGSMLPHDGSLAATTGEMINPEAFGVAQGVGSNNFAMLTQPGFQAAASTLGWPLLRLNTNGQLRYVFPTRDSVAQPIWNLFDNIGSLVDWFAGRLVITVGDPPPWMDITQASEQQLYADMAAAIVKRLRARGIQEADFEIINEPDLHGIDFPAACATAALSVPRLRAIMPGARFGGPGISNVHRDQMPAMYAQWRSVVPNATDFVSYHNYSPYPPQTDNATMLRYARTYATQVKVARGMSGPSTPVLMGEYNIDGWATPKETRQQGIVGAVYTALAICTSVVEGGLERGAIWQAYDEYDCYGILDASFRPYPNALVLAQLVKRFRGRSTPVSLTPPPPPEVYACASRDSSQATVVLINSSETTAYHATLRDVAPPFDLCAFTQGAPYGATHTEHQPVVSAPPLSVTMLSTL